MTENSGQQHILDAIERLLAGETADLAGLADEEKEQMLRLARDLREHRPRPSAEFEQRMERKIMQEAATTTEHLKGQGKTVRQRQGRWLPPWFTVRRVAALSAALVLGLGMAGLTGVLMQERDSGYTGISSDVAGNTGIPENDNARSIQPGDDSAGVAGAPETFKEAGQSGAGAAAVIPTTRQVIQTADYQIEVANGEFQEKYGKITALAAKYGGFVVSADTTASRDDQAINRGTVTIRIADVDDNFTRAMSELDELGKVVKRTVSGDDVSAEYVDLQSRLRNAQSYENSLLSLMEKAASVDEMLMVQAEINTARSQIEQLQGRINYIDSRADYATISVELREESAAPADEGGGDGTDWGFLASLKYAGWLSVQTVNFVIMALGVIVPVTLMLVLVAAVGYRFLKRRRS